MIVWKLKTFDSLESTNTELEKYARRGAEEGLVIRACKQTAGRGRHDKCWFSPENGLYLSILLKPDIPREDINLLSFAMGIAIAEAIELETGLEPKLKWPNDIYIGDKKVGGILIENKYSEEKLIYLICGIGINVNQDISRFPDEIRPYSTSLFTETGNRYDIENFTKKLLDSVEKWYLKIREGKKRDVLERYRALSLLNGKSLKIETDGIYEGKFVEITDKGSLKIMTDGGIKEFFSGSIIEVAR